MWPIFLKVLSIIGIVIGGILGVVLLLLLILLLCPIVYKISGSAHDEKYNLKVRIHYLFGLVRAGYTYPEPGNIYAKVAWVTLYDSKGDKKGSKGSGEDETDFSDEEPDADTGNDDTEKQEPVDPYKVAEEETSSTIESKTDSSNDENGKKSRILNPIYHIKKAWENFRFKVIQKIKLIYKNISFYIKLLLHDDTQALLSTFKKQLVKILKQLIPKTGRANVTFGMDSPDVTAYIYGAYSLLFLKKANRYLLTPDFEKKIIEGDMQIKGWFNLFGIVICALPIVFSKKLRLTKARIEKHSDNMDIAKRKASKKHDRILRELDEEYSA